MAFGQEGRKAIVYQLKGSGQLFALKIFKLMYREPYLVDTCQTLSQMTLCGLEVCDRQCLTHSSATSLLRQYPEMEYAVLMPWIQGSTWFDIVFAGARISDDASKQIAKSTAEVLAELEARGFAHCDVAAGNVIVNTTTGEVSFIDVEDMFGPGLAPPSAFPQGTEGYQHRDGRTAERGQWCAEGDRFSAAVLLAEMLAWHDPQIRQASDEEHYFSEDELQDPNSPRYKLMMDTLADMSREIADCFACAWCSSTLAECPPLSEWAQLLEFPLISEWLPIKAPPLPPPYKPQWTPIDTQPAEQTYEPEFIPLVTAEPSGSPPQTPGYFWIMTAPGGYTPTLRWLPVQGAEGYIVEASDDEGFVNATQVYKGADTCWTDPEQPEGTRYYRVCAYNANGTSDWSHTAQTWE
jgi:serine/threonine protein kinase